MDAGTWHHRLGHMSEKGMKTTLTKGKLSGLNSIDLDFCEDCLRKAEESRFLEGNESPKVERLELIFIDVWGKASILSHGGLLHL